MIMRLYLCGPMTGLPEMNYPAFHAEAERIRSLGYRVYNPAENQQQVNWQSYMRVAIAQLVKSDAIALLPGWKRSRGALIEHGLAISLGIPARPCEEFQPMAIKQRPLTFRPLHLDVICDVCNKGRGHGNHQKCSKIRQKRNAWKWVEDDDKCPS